MVWTKPKPANINVKWVKNVDKPASPRKILAKTGIPSDKNKVIEPDI